MSEEDSSNLDISSHGIIGSHGIIHIPDPTLDLYPDPSQAQTPDPTPDPTPSDNVHCIPASTLDPTPSDNVESISITKNITSDITEEGLVKLIKKSIHDEDMKKKISISLSEETVNVINIISLSPNTLMYIEKAAIEIINDGKIDSKDVPNLIIIIQTIYQFIYSLKNVNLDNKKRADITATTLKYILHLLVLERRIKIEEDRQREFFTQTDLIIDSCVTLLSYSKTLEKQSKGWFRSIFG